MLAEWLYDRVTIRAAPRLRDTDIDAKEKTLFSLNLAIFVTQLIRFP